MTSGPAAGGQLARLGFRDPGKALAELPEDWESDDRWTVVCERIGDLVDPDAALRRFVGLRDAIVERVLDDPDRADGLLAILGFSEYLTHLVGRIDGLAGELLGDERHDRTDLRDLKDASLTRIAADDLVDPPTRASFEKTGRSLASLADHCLERALEQVDPPVPVAVIAMGKYGGRELNYASDIDVIFVRGDGDHDEAEEACRRLMQLMNGPPTVFRTDADLRPEGRDGPLVRTLDAYDAYYRRWAEVWEFQALIKSRFAAGDPELGERFAELVRPFVWPDRMAPDAVEQVRALKARAEKQIERRGLAGRQVKLGPGGIRDVEFAVQLLQLVHGRHHPTLRTPNTLEGLDLLGAEGFVAEEDAAELADAYVFLRHTEHRLQLQRGRQTHTLPKGPQNREHLARGLGYRDAPDASALEAFESRWREVTGVVRHIHERLFYRPLLEAFATVAPVGPTLSTDEARERLTALGFDRPPAAQQAIAALTSGSTRAAKVMRALLPGVLPWLAETPDPDAGLVRLKDLAGSLGQLPHLLAILRDEPPVTERICRALGTGPVLAQLLERDPGLIRSLQEGAGPSEREAYVREASSIVQRASSTTDAVTALRRFKDGEWLRIGVEDLGSSDDPYAFVRGAEQLSHLADACLEAALELARAEQDAETGGPPAGGFSVIAMGRHGGRELSHASDLDVMFAYAEEGSCPDGTEARLYHEAVAARVLSLLGSTPPIFKVDADLRPEGKDGPLARSLGGFAQYHDRWAQLWEFQAMLRARHAAGDPEVTSRLLEHAADRIWPAELGPKEIDEIRHMKARIERERVKATDDRRYQVKLGVGGLADVEFTVQLLQMRHGHDRPALRTPNTYEVLEAMWKEGIVDGLHARWLRDAYLLLNRVRNHMFLLRGLPTDVLPHGDEDMERLARSLGYGRRSRSRFLEHYRRVTRRARKVCDLLFYGEEE